MTVLLVLVTVPAVLVACTSVVNVVPAGRSVSGGLPVGSVAGQVNL